jgi:hypothetical protein
MSNEKLIKERNRIKLIEMMEQAGKYYLFRNERRAPLIRNPCVHGLSIPK